VIVVVQVPERPVADQFFDLDIDEIRRMRAVDQYHLIGGRQAARFVFLERLARIGVGREALRQCAGVDRALGGAVGATRVHRVGGVAGERHAGEGPVVDRVLVHRQR
jgi:hypothetical protein